MQELGQKLHLAQVRILQETLGSHYAHWLHRLQNLEREKRKCRFFLRGCSCSAKPLLHVQVQARILQALPPRRSTDPSNPAPLGVGRVQEKRRRAVNMGRTSALPTLPSRPSDAFGGRFGCSFLIPSNVKANDKRSSIGNELRCSDNYIRFAKCSYKWKWYKWMWELRTFTMVTAILASLK